MGVTIDFGDYKRAFADRLIRLIGQRNTSETAVAKAAGVSLATVSHWCNSMWPTMPDVWRPARTAEYLGTTTDYLAGLTDVQAVPKKREDRRRQEMV